MVPSSPGLFLQIQLIRVVIEMKNASFKGEVTFNLEEDAEKAPEWKGLCSEELREGNILYMGASCLTKCFHVYNFFNLHNFPFSR